MKSILLILASLSLSTECQSATKEMKLGAPPMSIAVKSTAFQQGMTIPQQFTVDGADQSPPLPPPSMIVKSMVELSRHAPYSRSCPSRRR
jgi:hypothetical protein